jgi:4-amino-4-deoxy-L-arabinose transferase-like glycosyltransferase
VTTTSAPATAETEAGPAVPRGAWLAAAGVTLVLVALGGRHGFHRDELYFLEAGRHPAWGYPDQPPLVPLLATGWAELTGGSLWAFRLVPAVLTGLLVVVASLTARAMGATRAEQVGTAIAAAVTALFVAAGHLFSTTTFDTLATATTLLLLIHALRAPRERELRAWLAVGVAAGVTMEIKTLVAFAAVAALAGLLAAGPREPLRRPGPYAAALVAAVLAAPNLVWQAANGWPQIEMGRQIAAGSSGTSTERWLVVPMQLLIVGPVLGVVLVIGLVALLRTPRWRPYRWAGVAYLVLLAIVVVTGGKPYYSAGLMLPLLVAGVAAVLAWAAASRGRRAAVGALLAFHVAGSAVITLPVAPAGSPLTAFANGPNPDQGETIGWDRFVDAVAAAVADGQPRPAAILAVNYGEAGALDRARRRGTPLPPVYSGHNAYARWGPPPDEATTVLVVGDYSDERLAGWFRQCRLVARFDDGTGIDNEEQDAPIRVCDGLTRPWPDLWPGIQRLS